MTNTMCRTGCAQLKYAFAGTEGGNQCYCGQAIGSSAALQPNSVCSTVCAGNSSQTCGGGWRIKVYAVDDYHVPVEPEGSLGCYMTTNPSTKANGLTAYSYSNGNMDTSLCRLTCLSQGYSVASLNFGNSQST